VKNTLSNAFGDRRRRSSLYRDAPSVRGEIHVRTRGGSEVALAQDVRRAVRDLDPELPVFNLRTMNEHVDGNLIFRRIPARLFAVLGPLLLMLTSIGIYAVVSYTVSRRTTEIGVRLALGATTRRVVAQFVGQSLAVAAAGALIGWAIVLLVVLNIVGPRAVEASVFLGVPAILLSVAAAASWLPVRRAAAIDPMMALRQE
jgi:predicted lysophospholipase L1 biosynthesis ABC-type transport system permease subunit